MAPMDNEPTEYRVVSRWIAEPINAEIDAGSAKVLRKKLHQRLYALAAQALGVPAQLIDPKERGDSLSVLANNMLLKQCAELTGESQETLLKLSAQQTLPLRNFLLFVCTGDYKIVDGKLVSSPGLRAWERSYWKQR